MLVPVINKEGKPLMPTKPSRARKWIKEGKATPFYRKGILCIRLNLDTLEYTQDIIVGIDPGSKRTGISVTTESKSILHIQCDTPTWVKSHVETRAMLRRSRRQRNTPYRKCRFNRAIGGIPPSTKARWDTHLRILRQLFKIIPVTIVSIEDIAAVTKEGKRKWNKSFSPLEVGKKYFSKSLEDLGLKVFLFKGYDTSNHRKLFGYYKSKDKLSKDFSAHCVDSFSLCEMVNGYQIDLTSKKIYHLSLLEYHRRQLHVMNPIKGGVRKLYGSTRSLGYNRGTLVKHPKFGLSYIGGTSKGKISLHDLSGRRLTQSAKIDSFRVLTNQSWLTNLF